MKEILTILCLFIFSFILFCAIVKKIKDIKQIQIGSNDKTIVGKVVGKRVFLLTGDIQPAISCDIDGKEVIYNYRYFYNKNKYPLNREVLLKVSVVSGMPYDKKDLIKDILFHGFFLIICFIGTVAGLYVFFVLR